VSSHTGRCNTGLGFRPNGIRAPNVGTSAHGCARFLSPVSRAHRMCDQRNETTMGIYMSRIVPLHSCPDGDGGISPPLSRSAILEKGTTASDLVTVQN
jgi:hypothetical protein